MAGRRTGTSQTITRHRQKTKAGAKKSRPKITKSSKRESSKPQSSSIFETLSKFLEILGRPLYWALLGSGYILLFCFRLLKKIAQTGIKSFLRLPKILFRFVSYIVHRASHFVLSMFRLKIPFPRFSFKWALLVLFLGFLIFILSLTYFFIIKDLPNPRGLTDRRQIVSTKIYDRHGRLLYKIYRDQNRSLVKLEEIPLSLIQATIAIEDSEFYYHPGLSFKGITRALIQDIQGGKIYGGSTITQQLVKNILLSPERTVQRKTKEALLALWTEKKFTKDEILEMYFNQVGYGGSAYGVEEASQRYFGKSVQDISLSEAALLAGLPASPTNYSPFGAYPEKAKERQVKVLERMAEEGYITEQESKRTGEQELVFVPQRTDIKAPHFVMYVKDLLAQRYGSLVAEEGGLEVITSLDLEIQEMAQKIVSDEVVKLANLKVGNGAALVTNPNTGEILAMVGSRDYFAASAEKQGSAEQSKAGSYFDSFHDGNVNVSLRPRQPGSSIKPVNYSLALETGFTPATIIPDTPITYRIAGSPPYTPRNYDNRFHGNVSLRVALASSYNVPAVKILSALGVNNMVSQGQKMGITTWDDPSRFGLSLTLGGGEVKMVDMAVAYGILANSGQRVDLNPILEVKNYKGEILEKYDVRSLPADKAGTKSEAENKTILDPRVSFLLTDILSDNSARTPAFGPHSQLNIPDHLHVAVKTGTTQNLRDNWAIGYTPDFLVAVWVGNNDNTPMSYVASGVTGASPIWNQIMSNLLKDLPDKEWIRPEGITKVEICPSTGTLPCEGCGGKWEYFLSRTEPKIHCNLEKNGNNP